MIDRIVQRMVGHGAAVLIVALLAGIGLLVSLLGGLEVWPGKILPIATPGGSDAWARTHVGGILNALLIFAVAAIVPLVRASEPTTRRLAWMMIGTGWANTVFYWGALFAPNRALTFGDNAFGPSNWIAVLALAPALLFAVITLVAAIIIMRQAFRNAAA
jgi:hypothetical protein